MKLPDIIEKYKEEIVTLCKRHHVKELSVFGSIVRDDFDAESDIDFLVEYDFGTISQDPLGNMLTLKTKLELLLNRNVDLVEYSLLSNKYLKFFIRKEKQILYA